MMNPTLSSSVLSDPPEPSAVCDVSDLYSNSENISDAP